MKSKAFVILNPASARGRTLATWSLIEKEVRSHFESLELMPTQKAGHATELAGRAAHTGGPVTVLAMGGDGTIHEVVNGLFEGGKAVNPDVTLGFLPTGSGNDLVRGLGLPNAAQKALAPLRSESRSHMDIGWMRYTGPTGRPEELYFANSVSFGLSGMANRMLRSSGKVVGGKLSYLIGGLGSVLAYKPQPLRLSVEGREVFKGRATDVIVANGRYFGGGMLISPLSQVSDGELDLVVIAEQGKFTTLKNFGRVYNGSHLNLPTVSSQKAVEVRAEAPDEADFEIEADGEVVEGRMPFEIRVLPAALKVLL